MTCCYTDANGSSCHCQRAKVAEAALATARADALREAVEALRAAGSFGRTASEKHAALEQYCLCRDAILALIPQEKPHE